MTPRRSPFASSFLIIALLISAVGPGPCRAAGAVLRAAPAKVRIGAVGFQTPLYRLVGSPWGSLVLQAPLTGALSTLPGAVVPAVATEASAQAAVKVVIPETPALGADHALQLKMPGAAVTRAVTRLRRQLAERTREDSPLGRVTAPKRGASQSSQQAELGVLFDQSRARGDGRHRATAVAARPYPPAGALLAHDLQSFTDELPPDPPAPTPKKVTSKLPRSYRFYVVGKALFGAGQQASTILIPVMAYTFAGVGFAALVMAVRLGAAIPGSLLGGGLVRRLGSKNTYLVVTALNAAAFLSVPILTAVTGSFPLVAFAAFVLIDGFAYGALRGVAEKRIATSILGRYSRRLLEHGGSVMFFAYRSAEIVTALATAGLILWWGDMATAGFMGTVMALALLPLALIKRRAPSADTDEEVRVGEKRLPFPLYLPFIFAVFMYLTMYEMLAPFFALEVFHNKALAGLMLAAYAFGGVFLAGMWSLGKRLREHLSQHLPWLYKTSPKQWAGAGILLTSAFMWTTLLFPTVPLTLLLAGLLGAAMTANEIIWRVMYQHRLDPEHQLAVFKWLGVWSSAAAIVPLLMLEAGSLWLPGVSVHTLLMVVAGVITAVSLVVPLILHLWRRHKL